MADVSPAHAVPATSAKSIPQITQTQTSVQTSKPASSTRPAPRGPPLHQIYAQPLPLRTFPLPHFYPSNPLSWLHVAYTWLSQTLSSPREPSVVHRGVWCPETGSIHVTDARSIRALWEQGFFGKGAYSRSEPNWLKREESRRDQSSRHVAELHTAKVREQRRFMKWERARREQDAIRKTRLKEAQTAPVGPTELLALPNSARDHQVIISSPVVNDEESTKASGTANGAVPETANGNLAAGILTKTHASNSPSPDSSSDAARAPGKRRKSVRFSPNVESTTYDLCDPPSWGLNGEVYANGKLPGQSIDATIEYANSSVTTPDDGGESPKEEIIDREHLQLTPQEAFFLSYGLGTLAVVDEGSSDEAKGKDVNELLDLFRRTSYVPTRPQSQLQPDDPFLVHYVVYHHFRSLGWVVRPGIKFGVDWLVYHRGPVFSHAEFAIAVMPTYTHPTWKAQGRQPPSRSWHWLHTVNRVQAGAIKTLVLVYVDIPPPDGEGEAHNKPDVTSMLSRYTVREMMIKRWVSNRNRD